MMKKFWKDESGQGMVEYGLIIAVVAVVVVVALALLGTKLKGLFENTAKELDGSTTTTTA